MINKITYGIDGTGSGISDTKEIDLNRRIERLFLTDYMVSTVINHYNKNGLYKTYSREEMLVHIIENLVTAKNDLLKRIEDAHKFCASHKVQP